MFENHSKKSHFSQKSTVSFKKCDCEFCQTSDFKNVNFFEKWDFENLNFRKSEIFKMWILSKMRYLIEMWLFFFKWDFENVNFVKTEILKMWLWSQMWFWKCEFWENWDLENVNFVNNDILITCFFDKMCIFAPVFSSLGLFVFTESNVKCHMLVFIEAKLSKGGDSYCLFFRFWLLVQ